MQSSRLALGRSILLMTGMTLSFWREREVRVRHGLRLDALRGVDQQHRAFTGRETARDLVGKVHVARRVHQVELVDLARPSRGTSSSPGAT